MPCEGMMFTDRHVHSLQRLGEGIHQEDEQSVIHGTARNSTANLPGKLEFIATALDTNHAVTSLSLETCQ